MLPNHLDRMLVARARIGAGPVSQLVAQHRIDELLDTLALAGPERAAELRRLMEGAPAA